MERRDFFKYLVASGAFACAGCNSNFYELGRKNKKNKQNKSNKKFKIAHLGIPICYHCNLNCAYCNHYSPIAPVYEMPVEVFEKDIKKLYDLAKGEIGEFALVGGEPLLHKDIEKLIEILYKYFPDAYRKITTNGILLKEMPESFWKTCKRTDTVVKCTAYVFSVKDLVRNQVQQIKNKYNVRLSIAKRDKIYFGKTNFSKNITPKSENNWKKCVMNVSCAQLDNGKIYPCCIMSNIRFFNDYFKDYAIPLVESDYIDIHNVNSVDEIIKYFKNKKEFCKYCNYGKELVPWRISKKEISEWYDVGKV